MNIIISIPVHEKTDIILDQIKNIKHYVPRATIVLHISKNFINPDQLKSFDFSKFNNVMINPERLPTKYGSIIQAHISNFKYAKQNRDFDYFALHASNDMFVRKGVEKYIKNYDAGFEKKSIDNWYSKNCTKIDFDLKKIMNFCDIENIVKSQVEGSFYKYNLFEKSFEIINRFYQYNTRINISSKRITYLLKLIYDIINPNLDISKIYKNISEKILYPREEVYFPTICNSMTNNLTKPYVYSEVRARGIGLTKEIIDHIRKGEFNKLPHPYHSWKEIFAVKRVPREYNHPLRTYIRNLIK